MNYVKRIGTISLAIAFFVSIFAISSSAQVRGRISIGNRPAAVRTVAPRNVYVRPYWGGGYGRGFYGRGYWGDPFWGNSMWNDPYYTNPRLRALADRAYAEDQVRSKRKDIREYKEKIGKDGYVTDKEQEKLAKKYREYDKRVQKLNGADY